jgi:transcriptional regulator with GAF, ATPase, and Fis domain
MEYALKLSKQIADNQDLLSISALFRGIFSIDWLLDLAAESKPSQILSRLEEATKEGLLVKKDPGHYCFADEKRRMKWANQLPENKKRQLHVQIADILLRDLPDDGQKAYALAPHLIHISNDLERCRYLIKAGDLHMKAFSAEDALQCYSKALDDLSNLNDAEGDRLYYETAVKYSKISTARHDTEKVLAIIKTAFTRAQERKNTGFQALLLMHRAKNEWLRSRYRSALKQFENGWALAKELNDPKILKSATTFSAFFLFWQGRFKDAVQIYERSVADVAKYPQGGFPLLAVMTVGYCYAQIGQVTQGLGMLDAIRTQCLAKRDFHLASYTTANLGNILIEIGRIDEGIQFLKNSAKEAKKAHNDWVWIIGRKVLAYAYYLKGDRKQTLRYLSEFLQQSRKVKISVYLYPYLMELCLAMQQGDLPLIEGLSLEKMIQSMIKGKNIFLKGVAYRYEAILRKKSGEPHEKIIRTLEKSMKWLEESGQQIELSKTKIELARNYISMGEDEKAKDIIHLESKILASVNKDLIPDDLRAFINDRHADEKLLKEILGLGQEVVTIRDNRELVQHILSTLNRITGAERGAIFLLDKKTDPHKLVVRGSKNLTSDQISDSCFASSMKLIEEVALSGKGRILSVNADRKNEMSTTDKIISSCICVPMILRDKTVGVLYHDNRLLSSAFKEPDLELLSYFAALAAFAFDNVSAYEEIQRLNQKLSEETRYYKEEHLSALHFEDIVGESSAVKSVLAKVDQVTGTDATVMIIGETGVGKELVARAIHRHSGRRDKPFIRVHCSALPESLIPSELFGHEKGAFTGATRRRLGRFELADGGTLFLDEIGDLSLDIQVRLLRVLQSKEFERVGGSETLSSDFRLVVATNSDLEKKVKEQKFRADLYYRLAVFPIYVPPLRERKEDIPLLAHYFLQIYSQKRSKKFSKIADSEMEKLFLYDWPGNVRELENIIERGTILNAGPVFRVPELGTTRPQFSRYDENITLKENERRHILQTLRKTGWKVRGRGGAAELLDLPPSTLAFRMKKLGIQRPGKASRHRSDYQKLQTV